MTEILWALGGLMVGMILFYFLRGKKAETKADSGGLVLLQSQILELTKVIDGKLHENSKMVRESLHTQFGESQKLIKEITEELTSVKETGRRVEGFAEQLQSLQDILKNPKQRGILGEYYLETLLKNTMPPECFQMQYPFPDGTIVDAAVFVKDKVIPIDSQFSLENYNRLVEETDAGEKERLEKMFVSDLKNRILETSKYIQPENGTMEFAFMFIPHEAIYYDLLINKIGALKGEDTENLLQRAAAKYKVIIVSPTSFLAYLQTVLQGLNSMKIEEKAKDIIANVAKLRDHLPAYEEYHGKLGSSLGTVVNHYNASNKEFKKVDKDILRLTGESLGTDLPLIDKPDIDV
jgi:DNA recombination protein RmuC